MSLPYVVSPLPAHDTYQLYTTIMSLLNNHCSFLLLVFGLCYATTVLAVCNVGVLWPNGWMDQDATWYGGRPWPRWHCVRWGPSYPAMERGTAAPTFRPMSTVAKWSPISATAGLFSSNSILILLQDNVPYKWRQWCNKMLTHTFCCGKMQLKFVSTSEQLDARRC